MNNFLRYCLILLFIITQSFIKAQPCPLTVNKSASAVCTGFQSTITAFGANSYTWTGTTFTAPVFSQSIAVGPGTYTVSGDTHTCSLIVTIGQLQPLIIQINQSSATTCIESNSPIFSKPVTFIPSGAAVYNWIPPIPANPFPGSGYTVRQPASACYTVVGSTNICSGTAVACVTVVPQFSIAVTPQQSSICEGESIALTVSQIGPNAAGPSSAFTYSWTDLNSSLNTIISRTVVSTPTANVNYSVEVKDSQQCLSTPATASITINVCTGFSEKEIVRIAYFPNPISDYLNVKAGDAVLIEITDALGKKVIVLKPAAEQISRIDTSLFMPGIYFLTVINSEHQESRMKVIKN